MNSTVFVDISMLYIKNIYVLKKIIEKQQKEITNLKKKKSKR